MKKTYLYIFLIVFIMGFLFLPKIGLSELEPQEILKNKDKIELKKRDTKDILHSLIQKITDRWMDLTTSNDFKLDDQAVLVIVKEAIKIDVINYLLIDTPKEVSKDVIMVTIKAVRLILAEDISVIIKEIEKLTVKKAKEYAINWLLQNEIRVNSGNLKVSYRDYSNNKQNIVFPYIIVYRPLNITKGEVGINIYSSDFIKTPYPSHKYQWEGGIEELPPFILKINGLIEKTNDSYKWIGEPEIKVVFDEKVPDFDFKEPGFFEKYVSNFNSKISEAVLVMEIAREKTQDLAGKTGSILKEKVKKTLENIRSFFSKFNLFQASVGQELSLDLTKTKSLKQIEPVVEKLSKIVQETEVDFGKSLGEMQEIVDDIDEGVDMLNREITDLIGEPKETEEVLDEIIEEEIKDPFFRKNKEDDRKEISQGIYGPGGRKKGGYGPALNTPSYCNRDNVETEPLRNKIVINEIAWMGTQESSNDEWIELINITDSPANLSGWQLLDKEKQISIIFEDDVIPAKGFYLLERTNDESVPDITADLIYTGALNDTNEALYLFDSGCIFQDEVITNSDSEGNSSVNWLAGNKEERRTMERNDDLSWSTYTGDGENGIMGTPKAKNSGSDEKDDEKDDEEEKQEWNDTIAPEVIFDLDLEQVSLFFSISFEITDKALENESVSGMHGFTFRWKEENNNDWIEDEYQEIPGAPVNYLGEIDFSGEDKKTYYFQIKAKDSAENESIWLTETPSSTTINIPKILINEIQIDSKKGSGGVNDDWVELYNPNDVDVFLNGWSIQEHSFDEPCSTDTGYYEKKFDKDAVIPSNGFFLIVGTGANDFLKNAADMTIAWLLTDDNTIYLVKNQEKIEDGDDLDISDKVGFGESCFPEGESASNPDEEESIQRKELGEDTDNNKDDFEINKNPSPTNSEGGSYYLFDFGEAPWPMFQHDSQHTGRSNFSGFGAIDNPETNILIKAEGNDSFCPPSIDSSGMLYLKARISGQQGLYAFYPFGSKLWYYSGSFPCQSPVIGSDGVIYSIVSNTDSLIAINSEDGTLKWEKSFENAVFRISPIIVNNILYLLANGPNAKLIALDLDSGDTIWEYELGEYLSSVDYALAVSKDNISYFGHKNVLYAIDSNGIEKWTRTFVSQCEYYSCQPKVMAPSISDDGTIYVVVKDESDWKTGQDMGKKNHLHAIDPENPLEDKWSKSLRSNYFQNPVIDSDGNIYMTIWRYVIGASGQSGLLIFDSNGEMIRNEEFDGYGRPGLMLVDSEKNVYILNMSYPSSRLHIFPWEGEQKINNFVFKYSEDILSLGGRQDLYISGKEKLYLVSP